MPTKTVDILLNLEAKPPSDKELAQWFRDLEKEAIKLSKEMRKALGEGRVADADRLKKSLNGVEKELHDVASEAQKRILETSLKDAARAANQLRERMERIQQIGNRMALLGGAIVAPFALAVRKYVDTVGEGENTSKRILALQERWTASQVRLGRVSAEVLLPTLEKALDVIDKITAFTERNPGFVKAAVGIGASLVVLGGIVSTTAQIIGSVASLNSFIAKSALAAGGGTAAAGGGALAIPAIVTVATAALIALAAKGTFSGANRLGKLIHGEDFQTQSVGDALKTGGKVITIMATGWVALFEKLGVASDGASRKVFDLLTNLLKLGGTSSLGAQVGGGAASFAAMSRNANHSKAMSVILDLERANYEAEIQYAQARNDLIRRSNDELARSAANLASSLAGIQTSLQRNLGSLSANYAVQNAKAEQQYQQQRAAIIRGGGEELRRIEEERQLAILKLTEEHAERTDELVRARDALGLVKEKRDFEKRKSEIDDNANREIAQRRRDLAIQLQDLSRNHAQQRAERAADYARQVLEARENAKIQTEEAIAASIRERAEIMRQRGIQLQELARSYNEERRRRIQDAYSKIQEMGNALNAERMLRRRYYDVMLVDIKTFMTNFQNALKLAGGLSGGISKKAAGGYIGRGLFMGGEQGREFVLSNTTTRNAENVIGGQLTQARLLSALSGGRVNATLNDNRRFNADISPAIRREIDRETRRYFGGMVNSIGGAR